MHLGPHAIVDVEASALEPRRSAKKRDGLQKDIYQQLQDAGVLIVDEGVRVSRPEKLISHLVERRGIRPAVVIADTFAVAALRDCLNNRWPIRLRKTKWEQATEDIAAFRKLVYDGPLSVAEGRPLARLGLREVDVRSDDSGSASRLFKRRGERSRDDPAQAGVLAAGLFVRSNFGARVPRKPPRLVTFG